MKNMGLNNNIMVKFAEKFEENYMKALQSGMTEDENNTLSKAVHTITARMFHTQDQKLINTVFALEKVLN